VIALVAASSLAFRGMRRFPEAVRRVSE